MRAKNHPYVAATNTRCLWLNLFSASPPRLHSLDFHRWFERRQPFIYMFARCPQSDERIRAKLCARVVCVFPPSHSIYETTTTKRRRPNGDDDGDAVEQKTRVFFNDTEPVKVCWNLYQTVCSLQYNFHSACFSITVSILEYVMPSHVHH